jgi:hypothetical protein
MIDMPAFGDLADHALVNSAMHRQENATLRLVIAIAVLPDPAWPQGTAILI